MKRICALAMVLFGLLVLAAHSQTARIAANGAPRGTAAGIVRSTPVPVAPKEIVVPGAGAHGEDGTGKVYVIPGFGGHGS